MMKVEAHLRILEKKKCTLYVRDESMASDIDAIIRHDPSIRAIQAPKLEELLQEKQADSFFYPKSWEEGKDDPWLVFHTSGTTGVQRQIQMTYMLITHIRISETCHVYT